MYQKFFLVAAVIRLGAALVPGNLQEVPGDVGLVMVVKTCRNSSDFVPYRVQSLATSALWTVERVNYLDLLSPLKLGLSIYEVCNESDYFETIFELYQNVTSNVFGIISDDKPGEKVAKFSDALDIKYAVTSKYVGFLMQATLDFMKAMGWVENVTVFTPNERVLEEFFTFSEKETVCVKYCFIYGSTCPSVLNSTIPFIFFGYKQHFDMLLKQNFSEDYYNGLFVPLDGFVPIGLPDNTFVILPPHDPPSRTYRKPEKYLPVPMFFEIAKPILAYTKSVETFLNRCNSSDKITCLKNSFKRKYHSEFLTQDMVLDVLKIEPLRGTFVYDIYRVGNESEDGNNFFLPLTKVFEYSVFEGNLTVIDEEFDQGNFTLAQSAECVSYYSRRHFRYSTSAEGGMLIFRSEAWVYAFLSLSLLGVIFCISILIFILICIFRRDILEGNPLLTLALLLAVMLLFCSVLPFSLDQYPHNRHTLCISKSLSITLSYALVFSLLLSRCILLATAAKEIGFMSHVSGSVQSFLCLFIFGVQAALSLQVFGRCVEIFKGNSFVYLMSYNTMLLLLLLCLCPLIYKCQRNYREGKYFCFAIILNACSWFVWLPLYVVLDAEWREPLLCLGLVITGGIYLGAVFIPRTYLMTISAARDKITSAIPSLATAASTMDIYRASTQPVYDCVNVAAINAVSVARGGLGNSVPSIQNLQQSDLYTCPTLPEDEDFDFRCASPTDDDKITRF